MNARAIVVGLAIGLGVSCQHAPLALFDRPPPAGGTCLDALSGVVAGRDGVCAAKVPTVAAEPRSVCAIDGEAVRCWNDGAAVPAALHPEGLVWRTLAAAGDIPDVLPSRVCAIDERGALYCWGGGDVGELGLGATRAIASPTRVGTALWRSIALGVRASCGVTEDGELFCWGGGIVGVDATADVPTRIGGRSDWEIVAGTNSHFCALSRAGEPRCFGRYSRGRDGEIDSDFLFEDEYAVPPLVQIAAGFRSACGIDLDGAVWCWGEARVLGAGSTSYDASGPVRVPGVTAAHIAIGGTQTCAVPTSGLALQCWGSGDTERPMPERLDMDRTARFVAGSHLFMCALEDSRLGCLGSRQRLPAAGASSIYAATQPL